MARRTKAEAIQTRESILDAAELLFSQSGVAATSLDDIAKAAGVTRGAVYWHFDSKFTLFDEIYTRAKLPLDQMLETAVNSDRPLESLEQVCIYALKHMVRDKRMQRVHSALQMNCETSMTTQCMTRQQEGRNKALARFEKILTQAKRKGELATSIKPSLAACALLSYMGGLFSDYLRLPDACPIDKQAKQLVSLFFNGIRQ